MADYITCWGDSKETGMPYRKSDSFCATKNNIYLNSKLSTGTTQYIHHYLEAKPKSMNQFQFAALMQSYYSNPSSSLSGYEEDFTEFQCKTDHVQHHTLKLKMAFCLRQYKKFTGLYDMVLSAASLTEKTRGIVTTLSLSGVSYENAIKFSKHYMETFRWKHPS